MNRQAILPENLNRSIIYVMPALKKTTINWMTSAKYDIESARHMFKTGRYLYVIFLCHLAIEKMLKAIVAQSQERHPPYTHDLYELIALADLDIPPEHQSVIAQLNELSIATRYPEDFEQLVKHYQVSGGAIPEAE